MPVDIYSIKQLVFQDFFNLFRVEDILSDKKCCNYCSIFIYRLFFTKCISWDI